MRPRLPNSPPSAASEAQKFFMPMVSALHVVHTSTVRHELKKRSKIPGIMHREGAHFHIVG